MNNTLTSLNNYLFEQIERINDDGLSDEDLEKQLKKADAIVKISENIIRNGELAFKTIQHMDRSGYRKENRTIPAMLSAEGEWK